MTDINPEEWPVAEKEQDDKVKGSTEKIGNVTIEGEFLLNLLSVKSHRTLSPLADLPRDGALQKFLSGGPAPPRIVGFWLPAAIADRIGKLLEYPITESFDKVPWEILRSVFETPPDILLVHLGKDPNEVNTKISEALEGSIALPPRFLALTDEGGGKAS